LSSPRSRGIPKKQNLNRQTTVGHTLAQSSTQPLAQLPKTRTAFLQSPPKPLQSPPVLVLNSPQLILVSPTFIVNPPELVLNPFKLLLLPIELALNPFKQRTNSEKLLTPMLDFIKNINSL
jgi:hypothetical protein